MSFIAARQQREDQNPLAGIDFGRLCRGFLKYYEDYSSFIKKATFLRDPTVMNWVLFGISGAGKSTTVARLLEDMRPLEFWQTLQEGQKAGKSTVFKDGVRIGHEVNSCTVVPSPFLVRNGPNTLHITDMPGFAESNGEKKISIDILQKCYMTTVKDFRLLVVVEISKAFETKFLTLRDEYHKALWNLFGPDYPNAIPHFYFILTKKNEVEGGADRLEAVVNKGIRQLMTKSADRETALFAQFLARMCDHHCVVDLERQSNVSLMNDIQTMIRDGEEEAAGLHIPPFDVVQLAAGESRLNALCIKYLKESAMQEQSGLLTDTKNLHKALSEELLIRTRELRDQKRDAETEVTSLQGKLDAAVASIKAYPHDREHLLLEHAAAKKRKVVAEDKLKIFMEEMKDDDFINIRIDASMKVKVVGRPSKHVATINADVRSDGSIKDLIIVMEYETDNDTLKNTLKNGDSLVPELLEDVEKIDVPSVLYNSKSQVCRGGCEVERPAISNDEGLRLIKIKSEKPFKVYIFTARRSSSMPFFNKLMKAFQNEVVAEGRAIEAATQKVKQLDANHEQDKEDKGSFTQDLQMATEKLRALTGDVDELLGAYEVTIKSNTDAVREADEKVVALQEQELVKSIQQVVDILRSNRIDTKAGEILDEFNKKFGTIFQSLHELMARIEGFKEANAERVTAMREATVALEV